MAGHSHWANIARKKALIDNKRGKLWSKLAKGLMVAAKAGGGDPNANLRLRYAIIDAKAGELMAGQVIDYIQAAGKVAPAVEGRITRLD